MDVGDDLLAAALEIASSASPPERITVTGSRRRRGAAVEAIRDYQAPQGVTCSPSGLTGQQEATGQVRQPGLTRAWKTGPAMPAATVSTRSLAQPGSASSASAPCR
jgi:hypothetical protein